MTTRQTEYLNEMFWRHKVISTEQILNLKSGDSMDIESSYLLNKFTAASPEAICSALETIMEQIVNFPLIKDLNNSPVLMSQTAFDILVEGKVEINALELAKHLNDKSSLTVDAAKEIAEAFASSKIETIAEICVTDKSKHDFFQLLQDTVNRLTGVIMRAAYWVALMSREEYSTLPPTYKQAMTGIGTAFTFKEKYFNRDCEGPDDPCGTGTADNNGWCPEELRGDKISRTKGQWYPLAGNAETIIRLLNDVKCWNAQGFTTETNREDEYLLVVESAKRNRLTQQAAAEGRALKAQAQAEEQVERVVSNISF